MAAPAKERFRMLRRLGAGGMGVVYEALDLERGTRVAVKTLLRADGEALLRFKREFRAFQDIEHPNLVRLYELVELQGEWFFTMELVDGVDFLAYVWREEAHARARSSFERAPTSPVEQMPDESSPADEARLRDALGQLTLGLSALHGAGKVHRDVKPSNALVADGGRVVLLDLGLVADKSSDLSSGPHLVGTASYMAPEQALGHSSPAADFYSVGVMLFHALTGQLPFSGSPFDMLMQKQEQPAPQVSALVPGAPADLAALCDQLLRRDPAARPDAREILRRLDMSGMVEISSSVSMSVPPRFVGREGELEALDEAFAAVLAGDTVTVVLHGRSGVGKSSLIREFTARARTAAGVARPLVLAGRCFENESLSYNALDGVIDALSTHLRSMPATSVADLVPDDASLLVRAFPVLAQVDAMAAAPMTNDVSDPDELRTGMLAALRQLFHRLAARSPLIIAIDDLQWANRDSLLLLAEITRPPSSPPMLLLISARGSQPPELELAGEVRPIAVEPLSAGDARELARTLLVGVGLPTDQAAAIAAEAEGHPLHIDALIRYAVHDPDASGLPKLDQALVARAQQLPAAPRRVLELACLAGAPITRAAMARAAQLEANDFQSALGVLRLHNLARTSGGRPGDVVEPYHDRVRESVAASLSSDVRHGHHVRLARALESAGGDPELLMRHQAACGDTIRAATTALRAARAAADALAFDRAAELYDVSLRLHEPGAEQQREITWRRSEALANAGRGDEAASSYLLAADGADKATRLECYRRASEQWLMTGHIDRGLETLRTLLAQNDAVYPATPRRAMVSLLFNRAQVRLRGLGWKARDESEIGREELTRVDMFRSVGQGIGMVDNIRGAAFQARGLVLALRAGEPARVGQAIALEAIFLASQGRRSLKRARALLARTEELARDNSYVMAWAVSSDGVVSYFEGRFDYAVATLQRALELWRAQPAGNAWEKNNVAVFQVLSLRLLGRMTELLDIANERVRYARRRGDRFLETTVRRVSNLAYLCADDVDAARASLAQTSWVPPEGRFHLQHWYETEARGELALYEGSANLEVDWALDQLRALRASLWTRVETVRIMANWLEARLQLAVAHERPAALDRVRKLARALAREQVNYARGFASMLHGALCESSGDVDGAVEHYRAVGATPMRLAAQVARRRIAALTGDDAERSAADAELRQLGVAAPERVGRLFAVEPTARTGDSSADTAVPAVVSTAG